MADSHDASDPDRREARFAGYETERQDVLKHVPPTARRVLDFGCSGGALGAAIKRRQGASVLGVDVDPAYADLAEARLDRFVVADAQTFISAVPPEAPFDCLVFADVLEHLTDPWTVLRTAATWMAPGGTAIVSVPNVLYYRTLARLVRQQRWPRDDHGIFDETHLRWFTMKDAEELVSAAGLQVEDVELRLWADGKRREPVLRALRRTPVRPYLAAQHIVIGRRPI